MPTLVLLFWVAIFAYVLRLEAEPDPDRPRVTHQDLVEELGRSVNQLQLEVGREFAPVVKGLADDLLRLLSDDNWVMPTRMQRLGLWLARCPAVPWRRSYSTSKRADGTPTAVLHNHGIVTGSIAALGRWLGWS